jgi:AcrR family transcriptional regulator
VQAVAGRAGMATGTIYNHFPSKGELFAEVFRDAAGRELELISGIVGERSRPAGERLAAAVEAFSRRALAAPTLAYALMGEPVDPAVEAARLENKRAFRDVFAALLREGDASGELQVRDPAVTASALVGALQEALIGPLAEGGGDALLATLVDFTLDAVNADRRTARKAA